jgi:hypothetical protein
MTMIDPSFLDDKNLPTVGAQKTFKYVKARDENGNDYYMPCTAAVVLGDEAVGVIIRVLRVEVAKIVRDELAAYFAAKVDETA